MLAAKSWSAFAPRLGAGVVFSCTVTASRLRTMSTRTASTELPQSSIPIFTSLSQLREWRNVAFAERKSVGFVPTMGALHEGHLSLVRHSLANNDLTVISIFVNPTQFAPHEDLSSYPRTLTRDLDSLTSLRVPSQRTTSAIFLPTVDVMYPSSVSQVLQEQKGTFVEVKGFGELMEGAARPAFFRGVATVVTKLFNAVQPSHAYFGQKDIQQALLLRRMAGDLLMAHPTPQTLHIIPTSRSPFPADGGLALSSRNAYLSPEERVFVPTLYRALKAGERMWDEGGSKEAVVAIARQAIESENMRARVAGADVHMDYVEVNNPWTFEPVEGPTTKGNGKSSDVFILSGAMWVGKTRLIDNILLGDSSKILY